jgi:hypothetical protein
MDRRYAGFRLNPSKVQWLIGVPYEPVSLNGGDPNKGVVSGGEHDGARALLTHVIGQNGSACVERSTRGFW